MNRNYISLFFSFVFIISIVSPSILSMVEGTDDIIAILDITEEENKENEMAKDFEINFLEISHINSSIFSDKKLEKYNFYLNSYANFFHSITSPPPEFA